MNRKIAFAFFMIFGVFLAVAVNFYALGSLWSLFGLAKDYIFFGILATLTFSFVLATFLMRLDSNIIFKAYYFLSTLWLGVMLILVSLLIIFDAANFLHPLPGFQSGIIILGLTFFITIFAVANARRLTVKKLTIPVNLGRELSIVQISDLHIGTLRREKYLNKIVEKINFLNPDIVVLTGDLFDGGSKMHYSEILPLNKIRAPVYFVFGNHDTYEGIDKVTEMLGRTKVKILRNELVVKNGLQIIGIDYSESKTFLKEKLAALNIDKEKPSLLLFHIPVSVNLLEEQGINLHLAGHTHAGQVFPFNFLDKLVYPYASGLHNKENSYEYVSPGTGTWGPYMRLGSKNEITFVKLK
jgi:predicted MPP superfamily phosphohydrolase